MRELMSVLLTAVGIVLMVALRLPAQADEARPLETRITAVTVYGDRAQVVREGRAALSSGLSTFELRRLPGWIDEGSVRVRLEPASAGRIVDVAIERTYLARADDVEVRAAEEAVQEIADQLTAVSDEEKVLESRQQHLEAIRIFSLEKLPRDAALRPVSADEYSAAVDFVSESLRAVHAGRRRLAVERRELEPELEARKRRLEELLRRTQLEQRTVQITVAGSAPVEAGVTVTYMLPGATWQPVHELRAERGATQVELASFAVVMQTSGEDWSNVALALSTQRSTEMLRIPELEALLLRGGASVARSAAASGGDSFATANRRWEEQNDAYVAAQNTQSFLDTYRSNQRLQIENTLLVDEVFKTLEQRGTTAHFGAREAQTIRSDGRRVRLAIGGARLRADYRILAAPVLSLNAVRIVELSNGGEQPLLPGKVSLYVDGAFLGLTEIDFIAPGEDFALYLGVADHLKLSRTLDRKRSELVRRGARTRMGVSFRVRVENLSDQPEQLHLRDRVPVSETEEIRVSGIKVTPESSPDVQGILSWLLDLPPRTTREISIEYTVEYPTWLATDQEELRRRQMPTEVKRLTEELRALEEQF